MSLECLIVEFQRLQLSHLHNAIVTYMLKRFSFLIVKTCGGHYLVNKDRDSGYQV